MNGWDVPTLTTCSTCKVKMAAMPGPRWRRDRPEPPAGHRIGYEIQTLDRFGAQHDIALCYRCVAKRLNARLTRRIAQ